MASHIWALDRTQTFDTDVRATWATQFNDGGTLTLGDRSPYGEMSIQATGYNAAMRPNGATYQTELRVEMDVELVGGSMLLGMAMWPFLMGVGGQSVFTINNYEAISGANTPCSIYRATSDNPQFESSPLVYGTAVHTLPVMSGVHTFAFEVINNSAGTGKVFSLYVDGTLAATYETTIYGVSEKFIGGLFIRQFGINILEYREFHRELAAVEFEVQTLVSGSPDAVTSAIVKAFNADTDLVEEQITTNPATGLGSFTNLRSGKSYYLVAYTLDNSYSPEAIGIITVP